MPRVSPTETIGIADAWERRETERSQLTELLHRFEAQRARAVARSRWRMPALCGPLASGIILPLWVRGALSRGPSARVSPLAIVQDGSLWAAIFVGGLTLQASTAPCGWQLAVLGAQVGLGAVACRPGAYDTAGLSVVLLSAAAGAAMAVGLEAGLQAVGRAFNAYQAREARSLEHPIGIVRSALADV